MEEIAWNGGALKGRISSPIRWGAPPIGKRERSSKVKERERSGLEEKKGDKGEKLENFRRIPVQPVPAIRREREVRQKGL